MDSLVRHGRSRNPIWLPVLLCLTGLVLAASGEQTWTVFRNHFRDFLRPGQAAATAIAQRLQQQLNPAHSETALTAALETATEQLRAAQLRERLLLAESATLHERLRELETGLRIPRAKQSSRPLVVHDLLGATVLSRDTAAVLRRQATIAVGNADDIDPQTYVLDGEQPLLDQGLQTGVEAGQNVYAGRNVIGRIAEVGAWTSSVRLITDPEFRGLARLARETGGGMIWGAEGRLEGNGSPHCVLRSIEGTQLVSVGDLVFTAAGEPSLSGPMFYGRVNKAELRPGAVEWDIQIEPAADLERLRTVHVLQQSLNPLRIMAQ